MSQLEQEEVGLQWSNVADSMSTLSGFSVAWTMGFLLIDTVVYMLIAWYVGWLPALHEINFSESRCRYISEVKPGQYGSPKPLYFLFLPSYWTGKSRKGKVINKL